MQEKQERPVGIQKVTALDLKEDDQVDSALAAILSTREVRESLGNILPDVLRVFAGDSKAKKYIFNLVGKYLRKSLSWPEDSREEGQLQRLLADEEFIRSLLASSPSLLNGVFQALNTLMTSYEELPADSKKEWMGRLLGETANGESGVLLTNLFRIANDIYQEDPEFLTHCLSAGLDKCVEETDFGELKVSVEGLCTDLEGLMTALNDSMFERPAKVVLLLAMLPPVANLLLTGLNDTVARFNQFPPDVVADAMLSLFREMDAKKMGKLVNELIELSRKLNVGSALTGQPGQPQFRMNLREFMDDFLGEIDGEVLWKFRDAWEQGRETVQHAMLNSLKKRPERVMLELQNKPAVNSYRYRMLKNRLELLEDLPGEDLLAAVTSGLSKVDVDSLAEVVNLSAALFNEVRARHSNPIKNVIDEFANALDIDECEDAVKGLIDDLGSLLKALGSAIAPHFISVVGQWMQPDNGNNRQDLETARAAIMEFLNQKEVAV